MPIPRISLQTAFQSSVAVIQPVTHAPVIYYTSAGHMSRN